MRALLVLLAIVSVSPKPYIHTGDKQTNTTQSKKEEKLQGSICPNCTFYQYPQKTHEQEEEDKATNTLYRDYMRWTIIGMGSTVVGVVGGLVGLWVIWCQTKATHKAADAALLNAKAVIKAERAWLLIRDIEPLHLVRNETAYAIVHLKNYGNTPAKVISQKIDLQFGDKNTEPPIWPVHGEEHPPNIIPPSVDARCEAQRPGIVNNEVYDQIVNERKIFVWLCGSVQYRDVFELDGDVHETYICYLYRTMPGTEPSWYLVEPQKYNKAT